ncbi:MAG TPA: nitroreductase family protein [Candidatus Aphodomonas merdavium]|nr:nitroreductase family protein [Candidatus Aphodomonas merdavium]
MKKRLARVLVFVMLGAALSAQAETAVDTILSAGTVQAFSQDAVAKEDIETILEAGISTASAMNLQPWYFAAVTDTQSMEAILQDDPDLQAQEGAAQEADQDAGASAKAGLGDSPLAIIIYADESASSFATFDCGLACQNMVIAANALGYGTKIIASPTTALNGENHDAFCEMLGVDTGLNAVTVLLVGTADPSVDAATGATTREAMDAKVSFVE